MKKTGYAVLFRMTCLSNQILECFNDPSGNLAYVNSLEIPLVVYPLKTKDETYTLYHKKVDPFKFKLAITY